MCVHVLCASVYVFMRYVLVAVCSCAIASVCVFMCYVLVDVCSCAMC